jgi:hypothetical protein
VGQTLDSRLEQLRAAGCTAKIYREKVTGAHNDRRELLKMLKALAPRDCRDGEAIAVYDDLLARFGTDTKGPLGEQVATALVNKGSQQPTDCSFAERSPSPLMNA